MVLNKTRTGAKEIQPLPSEPANPFTGHCANHGSSPAGTSHLPMQLTTPARRRVKSLPTQLLSGWLHEEAGKCRLSCFHNWHNSTEESWRTTQWLVSGPAGSGWVGEALDLHSTCGSEFYIRIPRDMNTNSPFLVLKSLFHPPESLLLSQKRLLFFCFILLVFRISHESVLMLFLIYSIVLR